MKSIAGAIVAFFLLACSHGDGQELSPEAFQQKITTQPGIILDVRTPEEFAQGHISLAQNTNIYTNFDAQVAKLDPTQPLYVYCQRGGRSSDARAQLKKKGFQTVYELKGGLDNWKQAGLATEGDSIVPPNELETEDVAAMIASGHVVVLDFSAKWCGPCRKLSPLLEKVAAKRPKELKVHVIDVDDNGQIAANYHIEELPTLLWFVDGKQKLRMIGLQSESELNKTLDEFLTH